MGLHLVRLGVWASDDVVDQAADAVGVGVSTRDLMARMGHDSMHAALIYQHATREVDDAIARALDERIRTAQRLEKSVSEQAASGGDVARGSHAKPSGALDGTVPEDPETENPRSGLGFQ